MSILVTGGAGYIGSHTVRRLTKEGREVVVLDTMEFGHRDAVIEAELVEGDIADTDLVVDLCDRRGVEQVVHFAAYKNVGESMSNPQRYWINNVAGTAKLAEALSAAGIDQIVFSSSCSVYGTPAIVPVTEAAPIQPESVYAESKATTERILRWYEQTHGLRSVSLRYFNAAGASADSRIGEDWAESLNLVPVAMKATLGRRRPLQVFGNDYPTPDGTCIRDYIHVDDLADAHAKALDYLAARRRVHGAERRHRHGQQRDGGHRDHRPGERSRGAPRDRRPPRRRPGLGVRRPDAGARRRSAGRRRWASRRSSPPPGRGTARTSTATATEPQHSDRPHRSG